MSLTVRQGVDTVWYAKFSIEQLLTKEQMIDVVAGMASWMDTVDPEVDWTQENLVEEIRWTLRRGGFDAKEEASAANDDQRAWAVRQVNKLWPKNK